ncbi:hypothetical protein AOE01nite_07940 [Acetobacter oeni]|uniref:Uncharacterized protein n=1 Tax=Acetobacter oeni TaxID=304077 RepID=A0A511XHY5_9PROT|nr:hypothetical protein AA21952_1595 [Acetobacter oeni LMG 21952]GEN62570.1 hypothetical protein AOE01nite_07940 [Acetobacter oeni]
MGKNAGHKGITGGDWPGGDRQPCVESTDKRDDHQRGQDAKDPARPEGRNSISPENACIKGVGKDKTAEDKEEGNGRRRIEEKEDRDGKRVSLKWITGEDMPDNDGKRSETANSLEGIKAGLFRDRIRDDGGGSHWRHGISLKNDGSTFNERLTDTQNIRSFASLPLREADVRGLRSLTASW